MKGITQLVGAIILILIAIGGAVGVLSWGQLTTQNYRNQSEENIQRNIESSEASFVIYNISSQNITIKNIGEIDLKIDSFQIYLDDKKQQIIGTSKTGDIKPDENVKIKVSTDLETGNNVLVTGQYNLADEAPTDANW
ncbi:MAG: hypothetical protein ABEK17_03245 [Candidatus Aenigmatarchaeota archaeon]